MAQRLSLAVPSPSNEQAAPARAAEIAPRASTRPAGRGRAHAAGVAVGLVGALLTAGVVVAITTIGSRTEHRLLVTQTQQGAAVLQLDAAALEHPLAAAAELATTRPADFRSFAAPSVGSKAQFRSMSLWRRRGGRYVRISGVGAAPQHLGAATAGLQRMLATAQKDRTLGVLALFEHRPAELVYGFVAVAGRGQLAAVGTQVLPRGRVVHRKPSSAFSELDYAIYLGRRPVRSQLVFATSTRPMLTGDHASAVIPFGDSFITLVTSPVGWLAGPIAKWLPWTLAAAGALLALAAGLLTDRLVGRRREAEALALEVSRLYGEQRTIAETLQQALLPDAPPPVAGLELAMRYVAGAAGVDVGGDWYDVVPFGERHVLAVVGDVSGRGVEAARVMAALRHAARAYAAEGGSLPALVTKLAGLLDVNRDDHFATLLAIAVDVEARTCRIVNAGHLPPLLVDGGTASFLPTAVAPPIGVQAGRYEETLHIMPPGATLVCYTDGLVERRAAGIEPGLEALRAAAVRQEPDLQTFVDRLSAELSPGGSDDAAVLALRWP